MIPYSHHHLSEYLSGLKIKTYRKNKIEYLNTAAAFDIEVSSWSDRDKHACMYIWMMGIEDYVFYGRTWDEWDDAIQCISDTLHLGSERKLIIYVHNLAYEFQFIRKRLSWERVFATEQRKPLECYAANGIIFRCSYMLSGESLEKVGEKLQTGIEKKTGQLDYTLIRHSQTELTPDELEYCEYDIIVVIEYIRSQIELNGGKITRIPLTKTGYVRNYCRKECLPSGNSGAWYRYRRIMNELTVTPEEYKMLHAAFQGGFTHACARYSHILKYNVSSYDFTSSYPAVMVLERFPMSRGYKVDRLTPEQFQYYLKYFCCLFTITFYNIDEKITADHPISASRCKALKDEILDNGRIVSASELTLTVTDVDYKIITDFYDYDSYSIDNFYYYYRGYLPTPFVRSVLGLYKDKTELKGVQGREHDYMLSKELLNSCYGMMVTNIIRDEITYTDDWDQNEVNIEEKLKFYNESKKRFISYAWGVWVTAYARYNLFTAIKRCWGDYIYSDTDSIKLTNNHLYKDYFEGYNNNIIRKIERSAKHHNLSTELYMPKTIKGETKVIGAWDYECTYDKFKTLGAKRYMVEKDGGIQVTVSGINKMFCEPYLMRTYDDPFKAFDNNLHIPAQYTGKNIHTYIDDPQKGRIIDYKGLKGNYNELSSVHIEEADYHLSVAQNYINFLLSITEDLF